jgi:pimeloyl-ACP methyl ester carboxylesterase
MHTTRQRIRIILIVIMIIVSILPSPGQALDKRPVILVPGMGASWNTACILFGLDCDNEQAWGFFPIHAQEVYQPLIDQLAAAGYTQENGYLKIVFYNWTQPLEENLGRLMAKIDQTRRQTGASQVDLVGHSMGGLLVRAYVQSDAYPGRNDAAHLVTIGSPHKGASKAYPYWQAGYLYEPLPEEYNQLLILFNYIAQLFPFKVYGLRAMIPSFQDILPTGDYIDLGQTVPAYLYDHKHGDQLIPEDEMRQRNAYLSALNAGVGALFERTEVYAFYGDALVTPARFYVRGRYFWEWPNWDDGLPIWSRSMQFKSPAGDGTVMTLSATLPCPGGTGACLRAFPGVRHSDLVSDPAALAELFSLLGIPYLPLGEQTPAQPQTLLVLSLYGPATLSLSDPAGRTVSAQSAEIPQAEYARSPHDSYQLILIPAPAEGEFNLTVTGTGEGQYTLSLLDTLAPPGELITDTQALWDTAKSHIQPGTVLHFDFSFTLGSTPGELLSATPLIQTPVLAGSRLASGRTLPESWVEIRLTGTDELLGSGVSGADGRYSLEFSRPLRLGEEIYASAAGTAGVAVPVEGYANFIPMMRK